MLSAPITPMRSPTATLEVAWWRPRPISSTVASSRGSPAGSSATMLRSSRSDFARPITVECRVRTRSAETTRAINCSTGASLQTDNASGIAGAASSRTRMIIGVKGAAAATRAAIASALSLSAVPGSVSTMAAGLISAAAISAPAQDISMAGNAPASVKACAKPPAGLLATMRIGPCSDILANAIPGGEGLQAYASAINTSSTAQAAFGAASFKRIHNERIDAKLGQSSTDAAAAGYSGKTVPGQGVGQGSDGGAAVGPSDQPLQFTHHKAVRTDADDARRRAGHLESVLRPVQPARIERIDEALGVRFEMRHAELIGAGRKRMARHHWAE